MLTIKKHKIRSISSVCGSWYRVSGTQKKPVFEKVAIWAVIDVIEKNDLGKYKSELIVGIPSCDIGVSGNDADYWVNDIAGYVEKDASEIELLKQNPSGLSNCDLCWAEQDAD
jgi:hypothetical protein